MQVSADEMHTALIDIISDNRYAHNYSPHLNLLFSGCLPYFNCGIFRLKEDDQEFSEIEEEHTTTIKFTSSQSTKVLEWVLAQGVNARPIAHAPKSGSISPNSPPLPFCKNCTNLNKRIR